MFDPESFLGEKEEGTRSSMSTTIGKVGTWFLHVVKFMFVVYGASHGISASLAYAGNHWWAQVAQIVGIIVTGLVLFGLYLMYMNGKIQGASQTIAAAGVYLIGFIFECMAIVTDSQMNSGAVLTPFLRTYLLWVLPIAPAIMGVGSAIVHALEPEQARARKQAEARLKLDEERFQALIDKERADLNEARAIRGMQNASRVAVIKQLGQIYSGPAVQQALANTAVSNMPALLRAAGIQIDYQIGDGIAASGPGNIENIEIGDSFHEGDVPNAIVGGAASRLSRDPSHRERREEVAAASERLHEIPVPESDGNGVIYRPTRGVPPLK